ncbi:hypothetical protein PsorP6_001749 [Peronosclerospora sorghi]|uniref:Uncharacterized protein n=1 Tax=Peronosclerospora sorghi TaxID=230839 RepID=A0ACC0WTV1_9STRA|nr:hypothetical protein PsorP6_001749 [Peronosclerospora sorghi]
MPKHALLATQDASNPHAPLSSPSRGASTLSPGSPTRETTLPAHYGVASIPHEDIESIRSFPLSPTAFDSVAGTSCASSSACSLPSPRWSTAPLTPRLFAASAYQPQFLLETLSTSSTIGGRNWITSPIAESIEKEERNRCSSDSTGFRAATMDEAEQRHEVEQTDGSRRLGGFHSATPTSTMSAHPAAKAHPMVIPPPAGPSVVTDAVSVAPTRKRKRIAGAKRMRNFLCMHPGCGKSFTDNAHLRDHTVVHTGEKKLRCPTCLKLFARTSTLQEHVRVHTGEKPYVCGVPGCEKRYSSRAAMRFHRLTHAPPVDFSAATQPLNGSSHRIIDDNAVQVLSSHVETGASASPTQGNGRSNTSSGVPPPFDENWHLQNTIRAQQDEIDRLKAEILRLQGHTPAKAARTPAQSQRTRHVQPALTAPVEMLRDGYKPFECCICHNRFANFYQLTFHGKQHPKTPMSEVTGGQTPLPVGPKHCPEDQCEYAQATGRSLRNLQTLKRHWQRRHQTERPYACSYCPATRQKTFKTRENLKAHEKDCTKTSS